MTDAADTATPTRAAATAINQSWVATATIAKGRHPSPHMSVMTVR